MPSVSSPAQEQKDSLQPSATWSAFHHPKTPPSRKDRAMPRPVTLRVDVAQGVPVFFSLTHRSERAPNILRTTLGLILGLILAIASSRLVGAGYIRTPRVVVFGDVVAVSVPALGG
ncbi:hypothetical protein BJX99DRAFT_241591, partial [Aspergillus californicus]